MKKSISLLFFFLLACSSENTELTRTQNLLFDAIIQQDESIQISMPIRNEMAYSNYLDVKFELLGTKATSDNEAKIRTLKFVVSKMDELNEKTDNIHRIIDDIKFQLLDKCGENTKTRAYDRDYIIWGSKNHSSTIIRLNLGAIKNKNNSEVATTLMNEKSPTGEILIEILKKEITTYSFEVIKNVGSYEWGGKKYSVEPSKIINLKKSISIQDEINKIIDNSLVDWDDKYLLKEVSLYITKLAGSDDNFEAPHWTKTNFVDESLVGTIAILTSIQSDLIEIRRLCIDHWKRKTVFALFKNRWR